MVIKICYIIAGTSLFELDPEKTIQMISDTLDGINDTLSNMMGILTQDPSTMPQLLGIVRRCTQVSTTIALILVVLYWLTHFLFSISEMDWRHISIEWYFREIVKLILAKALIDIAPDLCSTIFQFGAWALEKYVSTGLAASNVFDNIDYTAFKETLNNLDFFEHVFLRIDLLIPRFVMWILNIIIQAVAYIRLLQVCLMTIIAPIPLSTVAGENRGHTALNFIKEYVAVVAQAIIIILSICIYKGVISTIAINQITDFAGIMKICMATIVLGITVTGSQKIGKLFLGGH